MTERVFIVDEDIQVREFLYELISEVGFFALTLPGGRQALERLKNERPSLIIIDHASGEYSGISLAQKIREFDKDVQIIMLGAEPQEALAPQIKETNISAYLKKDFKDPEIIKAILSVLKQESFIKSAGEKKWGRVLIVDDELENCEMVGNFLSRRGFEVDTASSGEECLDKIKHTSFDVILLDITMDGMDGLLTLKRIMDCDAKIKVIMVTALQNKEILAEAKAIGACDYLIKPFNLGLLESSLISVFLSKGQKG